jgi:Uroporphyrinogen decarboxylase (URO-D)
MDRMTPRERIEAAVALRKPDRVPVVPNFDLYIARHAGITMRELLFDFGKAEAAFERAFADFRWDGNHLFIGGSGPYMQLFFWQDFKLPGVDGMDEDAIPQMLETRGEGPEIYEEICRLGFLHIYWRMVRKYNPWLQSWKTGLRFAPGLLSYLTMSSLFVRKWERNGIPCMTGGALSFVAFDVLSMLRSMADFSLDLHRHPDEVLRALAVTNRFQIQLMLMQTMTPWARYCHVGSARPSGSFISPKMFERFALPLFVEATERLTAEGITPFLHFDSDWTPMLPYLRELPRRRCVLYLDGTTDIFKAKEILGDHMCICGDVPASLLTLGTPEEVEDYCRRLIAQVGDGGGFILSSGCSTPPDARPENVRAMVESVREYR